MSSQSLPTKGHIDVASATHATDGVADINAFVAGLAVGESAFAPILSRGTPPLELLEEIYAAGVIHEQLRDSGRHLRFATVPGERTKIELHDEEDASVRTLSTTQALELAGGRPLE
jgi:hypothetical protein